MSLACRPYEADLGPFETELLTYTPPKPRRSRREAATVLDGASFALDTPATIDAVWGAGASVLWAAGESLLIVGPDGVGKTTLGQQLALARAGVGQPSLLGSPLTPGGHVVLYLALDRPRQAARSMRRMVSEKDRDVLTRKLVVVTELGFDLVAEKCATVSTSARSGDGPGHSEGDDEEHLAGPLVRAGGRR